MHVAETINPVFIKTSSALRVASLLLLFTAGTASAQVDALSTRRLRSPATVRGFIGGESHYSYIIRVRKNRILTVRIAWRREDDNRAEFTVTKSSDFNSELEEFGTFSNNGKRWTGKLPMSGDYYIRVFAHPAAHYTLKVTVK